MHTHAPSATYTKAIVMTAMWMLLVVYCTYHAFSGERGLLALMTLSSQLDSAKNNLDLVQSERLRLEHRVALLKDDSLDKDMLDEQIRRSLGYISENEKVFILDSKN